MKPLQLCAIPMWSNYFAVVTGLFYCGLVQQLFVDTLLGTSEDRNPKPNIRPVAQEWKAD